MLQPRIRCNLPPALQISRREPVARPQRAVKGPWAGLRVKGLPVLPQIALKAFAPATPLFKPSRFTQVRSLGLKSNKQGPDDLVHRQIAAAKVVEAKTEARRPSATIAQLRASIEDRLVQIRHLETLLTFIQFRGGKGHRGGRGSANGAEWLFGLSGPSLAQQDLAALSGLIAAIVAVVLLLLQQEDSALAEDSHSSHAADPLAGVLLEPPPSGSSRGEHDESRGLAASGASGTNDFPEPLITSWWELLAPELPWIVLSVLLAFGSSVAGVLAPKIGGNLLDIIQKHDTKQLVNIGLKLMGSLAAQASLHLVFYGILSVAVEKMAARLRKQLLWKILQQDRAFFDTNSSGDLLDRLSTDIVEIRTAVKHLITMGVKNLFTVAAGVASMFLQSPQLTLAIGTVVPVTVLIGSALSSILRKMSRRLNETNAVASTIAAESLSHVSTVQAFVNENKEVEKYGLQVDNARRQAVNFGLAIGVFQALSSLAINGTILGILAWGSMSVGPSSMSTGDLTSFLSTAWSVQSSMAALSILFTQTMRGLSAADRTFEIMKLKPAINSSKGLSLSAVKGDLALREIVFRYPNRPHVTVLDKVSIDLQAGKTLSLVGPSGSGKTTIAKLLLRFYDSAEGAIFLDGYDLKTLDPHWLRSQIGVVEQEPVLFSGSVAENIAYGKPNASREEIEQAAKVANCHEFISNFPQGYDTLIGGIGQAQVSGGQKQRIAIARALLKNPRILILDEATSALDAESEKLVQSALQALMKDRTTLIIAHRLSTIKNSDTIIVLQGGHIAETGNHANLMAKNGVYAKLVRKQYHETDGQ